MVQIPLIFLLPLGRWRFDPDKLLVCPVVKTWRVVQTQVSDGLLLHLVSKLKLVQQLLLNCFKVLGALALALGISVGFRDALVVQFQNLALHIVLLHVLN